MVEVYWDMHLINRRISVAPMMKCTDRHDRYFLRLITQHSLLYTEMVTSAALIRGDAQYLLQFDPFEHPLALQLGGSDPKELADAAQLGESFGYDEINLNVGCPSERVRSGSFGACLMLEPELVRDCIAAMCNVVKIPVTVKCRIGIDREMSYDFLKNFVQVVNEAGCTTFIVHARNAWLNGISPKENRDIPPLRYDFVYRLKDELPNLEIIINGGIKTHAQIAEQLEYVDGVMIGREAYGNPYMLAEIDALFYDDNHAVPTRQKIIESYLPYVQSQLAQGEKLNSMTRHILGLFHGQSGARHWRRYLSDPKILIRDDARSLLDALVLVG
jgi:tRNA-dihydrouridine synthase A